MHENSDSNWQQSNNKHYIYHPQRAFDEIQKLDAFPLRLFSVFFPIWRVHTVGTNRISRNYEEVEKYIELGIQEAGLNTIEKLSCFYGLDSDYIIKLVAYLQNIGHVQLPNDRLQLTELGIASVNEGVFYEEHETSAVLYFDGLGSRLLSRDHAKITVFPDPPKIPHYHCFNPFVTKWDNRDYEWVRELPKKKFYGLLEKVDQASQLGEQPVYIPIYVVHCRSNHNHTQLPTYLVFSNVRGRRDEIIEESVNLDEFIRTTILAEPSREVQVETVTDRMEGLGLKNNDWRLIEHSSYGMQAVISPDIFATTNNAKESSGSPHLTVKNVGEYLLAHEWCVWITCEDEEIRHQALVTQLLDWIQNARSAPEPEVYKNQGIIMANRLDVSPVTISELMKYAEKVDYGRALNRLDMMND